jgi:hypothetical protein
MDLPSWSYSHMNGIDTIPNTLTCEFLLSCVLAANGIVFEFARLDVGRRFSESATTGSRIAKQGGLAMGSTLVASFSPFHFASKARICSEVC